jgi:alpha-beta hydrolase superfamily lysophospholipase
MKAIRRAIAALATAGLVAAVLRLRGTGGTPPQGGGWRELSGPDLR